MIRSFALALLLLVAGCRTTGRPTHAELLGPPQVKAEAGELERTVVTPHLQQPLEPGVNVLWCATMQVAWNELCDLAGGEVHMQDEDPMVAVLNRRAVEREDLDDDTYIAAAGIVGEGILEEIRRLLMEKFAGAASPELAPAPGSLPAPAFVAYAYLFADLPFEWAFERLDSPLEFAGTQVECFGIRQYIKWQENEVKAAGQLRIYDFRDGNDFILEFLTRRRDHHLLLAKVPPAQTLEATIEAVRQRVAASRPEALEEGKSLIVPVFDLELKRDYDELLGKLLRAENPRLQGQSIAIARQLIRFRLDERGALLKSEAVVAAGIAKDLVFDRPFLVMLQYRRSTMPYFALWVDNAELLVPFTKESSTSSQGHP